ncbi:hypothetical protein KBD20_01225 [Candidatus Saccharibacteria bacterium]|nr:hypothetical protein [Candidatus Saccharibacteria bacterium]
MPELLGTSKNGCNVFTDIETTNIKLHILENPGLLSLVKEVIERSNVSGPNVGIECNLGRVVGQTSCVKTSDTDEIVFAKRKQRDSYSRFVKNRRLEDTSIVSVVLFQKDYGYLVWSAWCGALVPTSPDSEGKMKTSEGFWDSHALVYDPGVIQIKTERPDRPDK